MERRRFFGLLPFLAVPAVFEKKEDKPVTLEDKVVKATQISVTDQDGTKYNLLAVKQDEEMTEIGVKQNFGNLPLLSQNSHLYSTEWAKKNILEA